MATSPADVTNATNDSSPNANFSMTTQPWINVTSEDSDVTSNASNYTSFMDDVITSLENSTSPMTTAQHSK
jgi:hypothetical protein